MDGLSGSAPGHDHIQVTRTLTAGEQEFRLHLEHLNDTTAIVDLLVGRSDQPAGHLRGEHNPWVRLVLADVQPPGGTERFEHHVVRLFSVSVAVVLDDAERVLMLWRHRFVADQWGWELPGGIIDDGEDGAQTAAPGRLNGALLAREWPKPKLKIKSNPAQVRGNSL